MSECSSEPGSKAKIIPKKYVPKDKYIDGIQCVFITFKSMKTKTIVETLFGHEEEDDDTFNFPAWKEKMM